MLVRTFELGDVIVGVDTHKDAHVSVAIDHLGRRLGDLSIPTNQEGYEKLLSWAKEFGGEVTFGVEGCGSYGSGLSRFLRRSGISTFEATRPPRRRERRAAGKSDLGDAEHAAREVLSGKVEALPKKTDGVVEMIRLVKVAKDTAVKARSQVMVALKSNLVTANDALRAELESLSDHKLIASCIALKVGELDTVDDIMGYTLSTMAERWKVLDAEIKAHVKLLERLTREASPKLCDAFGVGFDSGAELLCAVGENHERIRSEAAFAKLCGACPIPASSGRTDRHRLCRGGNRRANAALYRIVIVRMRWHEPTKAYVARRTSEGLSKKDIIRCLKRYVAREVYHLMKFTINHEDDPKLVSAAT